MHILFFTCYLTVLICAQDADVSPCSDDLEVTSNYELTASYDELTGCKVWSRAVTLEDGYGADVIVQSMALENNDYITINAGLEKTLDISSPLLSGAIRTPRTFRVPTTNKVYIEFVSTETSKATHTAFKIKFEPFGEITTPSYSTTEGPDPQCPYFPVAPSNITYEYTVYIKILDGSTFENNVTVSQFKMAIQSMALSYYRTLSGDENFTESDICVRLLYVDPCRNTWPDSRNCYEVTMAIPVNDTDVEYELSANHIQDMWFKYAFDRDYLSPDFQAYKPPDTETTLITWLSSSVGVIVIFTAVLLVWRLCFKDYSMISGKDSDSQMRISMQSKRDSWIEEDMPYQDFPTSIYEGTHEFEPEYQHTKNMTLADHNIGPIHNYRPPVSPSSPYKLPPQEFGASFRFGPLSFVNEIIEEEEDDVYSRTSHPATKTKDLVPLHTHGVLSMARRSKRRRR